MATNATLTFQGSDPAIKVLNMDIGFSQNTDYTGKPTGRPHANDIHLVVESTSDTQIIDWMASPGGTKNGKIEIVLKNNVRKTIEFRNAYCVEYRESFSFLGSGDVQMNISFTISVEEIIIDGVSVSNVNVK